MAFDQVARHWLAGAGGGQILGFIAVFLCHDEWQDTIVGRNR